jgi:hypothetical protein
MDFLLDVRLRLTPTQSGGRHSPIRSDYRPSWDLGNTWLGQPTLNDGRVLLDPQDAIAPGDDGLARIQPHMADGWGGVRVGMTIPMQEGNRVVGHATILTITRDPLLTPAVLMFVAQVRQFCAFVEQSISIETRERLLGTRLRLLALYQAALALPLVTPNTDAISKAAIPPPRNWVGFGTHELYWEVFDPYVNEEPVTGELSEDILEVLGDVRGPLSCWDAHPPQIADAIWEWRFSFDSHWGNHAIDALRALHRGCGSA